MRLRQEIQEMLRAQLIATAALTGGLHWYDICADLKCTQCGSVGWVGLRPNWGEVIDYNRDLR